MELRSSQPALVLLDFLECCKTSKLRDEIIDTCNISIEEFQRFRDHCIQRNLLIFETNSLGLNKYLTTQKGNDILCIAREIEQSIG